MGKLTYRDVEITMKAYREGKVLKIGKRWLINLDLQPFLKYSDYTFKRFYTIKLKGLNTERFYYLIPRWKYEEIYHKKFIEKKLKRRRTNNE